MTVTDTLGRPVRDLRISVTDRCNFRCVYCMPKEVFGREYRFLPRRELLTFEEIERVARAFVDARRAQAPHHRRRAAPAPRPRAADRAGSPRSTTASTSRSRRTPPLLAQKAQALADAGLSRITVSLDSLDDEVFRAMNDVDFPVARVLAGIDAAAAAGLPGQGQRRRQARAERGRRSSTSRGASAGPATPFASSSSWTSAPRTAGGWRMSCRPPRSWRRSARSSRSSRVAAAYRGEVAERYRYLDGAGEIGVIASVTQPFCGDCTRARTLGRRKALHLPLRGARARPSRDPALGRGRPSSRSSIRARLDAPRRPLLGDPHRADLVRSAGSRCRTSAARRLRGRLGRRRSGGAGPSVNSPRPGASSDLPARRMIATDASTAAPATDHLDGDALPEDQPAEHDGDHRVDVGVGRDERRRRHPQQPDVRREADEAPDHDQVGEGEHRILSSTPPRRPRPRSASTRRAGSRRRARRAPPRREAAVAAARRASRATRRPSTSRCTR